MYESSHLGAPMKEEESSWVGGWVVGGVAVPLAVAMGNPRYTCIESALTISAHPFSRERAMSIASCDLPTPVLPITTTTTFFLLVTSIPS